MLRYVTPVLVVCLLNVLFAGGVARADGFVTSEGRRLLLDGNEYRAIGANQPDLFTTWLKDDQGRTNMMDAILDAERNKVAFFRFWASGFWPVDMKLYFEEPETYWERMDEVFALCRDHNIRLVPSIFWHIAMWPDICDEPRQAMLDPESRTFAAMHKYAGELVSRYKDDTNVLCWEIGNEYSTHADLNLATMPGTSGAGNPGLGTRAKRVFEDSLTSGMIRQFMIEMTTHIKGIDPNHLVTSGDAHPRETSWSLRESFPEHVWTIDTVRQFLSSLLASQPEPLDVISIHHYGHLVLDDSSPRVGDISMHSRDFLTCLVRAGHAARCPVLVGELGCVKPSIREDPEARYLHAVIDFLEAEETSLTAIWAWHFPHQPENDIRGDAHPSLMKRIAEFNEKHAGL